MLNAPERTRVSSGEIRKHFSDRRGRPLGRSRFERLIRDFPELAPVEGVAGNRLWGPEVIERLQGILQRERECTR